MKRAISHPLFAPLVARFNYHAILPDTQSVSFLIYDTAKRLKPQARRNAPEPLIFSTATRFNLGLRRLGNGGTVVLTVLAVLA